MPGAPALERRKHWRRRKTVAVDFSAAQEAGVKSFRDHGQYQEVRHENVYENIAAFFAPNDFRLESFENLQVFDYDGLKGRLLSSSYVPAEGEPRCAEMLNALQLVFEVHQQDGRVVVEYDTRVYFGQMHKSAKADD